MRISTNMIFSLGVRSMNNQTSTLLHTQQQISANTRILTPSDDPVAAARALEVTQSKDVNTQFASNIDYAKSALGTEEAQLSDTNGLLTRIRELAVEGGNATLSKSDRESITAELRSSFDELLGLANAQDGTGQYMFSGYKGTIKPFAASVDAMILNPSLEATYQGDDGQRRMQVSASRQIEVSDAGSDVFMNIRNGNGHFVTDNASTNAGTGIIDAGNVISPSTWNALADKNYTIQFYVDTKGLAGTAGKTYYDIIDTTTDTSLLTGTTPDVPTATTFPSGLRSYSSGQTISLSSQGSEAAFDLGSSVIINGTPADGDSFTLAPSSSTSIFRTLANLIGTLEQGTPGAGYTIDVNNAIANIDQASDNILKVRAGIGSRLNELDFLTNVNSDLALQYQDSLSKLQDLDYAKALSDLTQQQTNLQAAQQSFSKINQLSLFDYLR